MRYWFGFIQELKARPNDGLISALLEAELEGDDGPTRLTDRETVGFCALLGGAGNETVTKLLANACVLFARHPEQYRRVLDDPGMIPRAVEDAVLQLAIAVPGPHGHARCRMVRPDRAGGSASVRRWHGSRAAWRWRNTTWTAQGCQVRRNGRCRALRNPSRSPQ